MDYMWELRNKLVVYRQVRIEYEGEIRKLNGEKDVTMINYSYHVELV